MKKKIWTVIIVIILFNILLLFKPFSSLIYNGALDINYFINNSKEKITNINISFSDKTKLEKEVQELKNENKELKETNKLLDSSNEKLSVENQNFKNKLKIVDENENKLKIAHIVYKKTSFSNQIVQINIGKKDGVKKNNLVLNNNQLIGYVCKVSYKTSEVNLITSANKIFNIPVTVIHNDKKYDALIRNYDTNKNGLVIKPLYANDKFELGDNVYTNGYTQNKIKDIYVGKINSKNQEQGINKEYYVNKEVKNIDYVEVVIDEK